MENTELSDGDLREISQRLGSEWKKPARCLGFNPREISSYMSSPAETENATFGILKKWRKRLPSDIDQSRHLGQALKKIGRHDLASVLNIQRDSYKSEASDVDKPSEGGMTTCHVCRQFQEKEGSGERTEDTELSDVALYEVSQRLGPEWKMLALHLGFNRREISDMSSPGQMENRIFDMLIKWLEQQPSTHDQSRNLCHALNKIGRPDLAALLNSWQGSLVNLLERSLDMLALWWKKQENPKDAGRTLLHTFKERRLTYLISEIQELAVISVLEAISKHHLKCSVCAERFQEPMALECLHSFCKRCLQGLSKDKSCTEISCPECRQKTRLPAAGVEGLKVNFRLNNVVEEIKKQEKLTASETSNEESDDSERQTSAASHPSSDSQEESRLGENSKDAKHKKECWQTLDQQELKCVSGEEVRPTVEDVDVKEICRKEAALKKIAEGLGPGWDKLAAQLHFDEKEICRLIVEDSMEFHFFKLLSKWMDHQVQGEDPMKKLRVALTAIGRGDLLVELPPNTAVDKAAEDASGARPIQEDSRREVRALREDVLMEIAKNLGPEWKELATSLGFSTEEISSMENGAPSDVSFLVLKTWNSRYSGIVDQFGKLCDELANIGRDDLVSLLLHQTELHQEVLIWTSAELGTEWKELALMLGFSAGEICRNKRDHVGDNSIHSLVMLKKWRQGVDMTKDQLGRLCNALTDVGKERLVRRLQHYRVVSGDKWLEIASFIREDEWVKLAGVLGFSSEEIDTIKTDTSGDWKYQCCSMLDKWNHRQSMNEDQCMDKLCAALTDIGRKGLAVLLQQHCRDVAQTRGSNPKTGVTLDARLGAIAQRLHCTDQEKLALVLGFSAEDVNLLKEFYPHELHSLYLDRQFTEGQPVYFRYRLKTACYNMLLIWKHRHSVSGGKLLEKLGEVLNEIGKRHLAILLPLRPVLINDEVLMEMVRRLGPGWKELVTSLGISSKEVATMEGDQPSDQTLCMLKEWNHLQGRNNDHFGKLCDVLANIGRVDLIGPLLHYTELHQEVLDWTSEELGAEWMELALMLGFSASEITYILKENLGDDTTHSLVMLKKWKQCVDMTKDQLGRLCDALKDVGKEDLVRRLQHYRVVSGDKWHDIASFIGEDDWVRLAGVLDFSSEEIDTIKTDTSDDWKDQCCSMLEKWNHRQSMNEDQCIEKLCAALTDIGRKGLAVLLQQHSHDETQIKSNSKTRVSLNNGLRALAESIKPADWEKLALVLGFGKEDLFQIEEFYPHDFQSSYFDFESLEDEPVYCRCGPEPAYSTLLIWKHRQSVGGDKLLEKLGEVLNEIGKSHLATLLPLRPVLINDEVLMEMVRRLGPGWKELVTSLGISSKEIATMEGDQPSDQALCMLKEWNRLQGRNNDHFGKLCDVLANIGRVDLIGPLLHYTELHQEVLDWTSEEIGPEWKELALMLGFSAAEINDNLKKNTGDDTTHSLVMLKQWRQGVDMTKDQLGLLCDALTDVGKENLVLQLQHYRVVSGDKWHDIASFIGEDDWVKLAGVLGFSSEEIDTIRADTPGDWKDQCCSMLDKWIHRQGTSEYQCIEKLCAALTDIGRKGLAILLQQHNQDEAQIKGSNHKTGVTLDARLDAIAQRLHCTDQEKLALVLGFSAEDVNLLKEFYPHELHSLYLDRQFTEGQPVYCRYRLKTACYNMLLIWKHRQSVSGDKLLGKLGEVLNEIGKRHLAILLPLRPVLIDDEVLLEMLRRLGPGWKELVTSLGISSKEVATMEGDQPSDQALCMLKEWNRLQGRNNDHFGKLCDALANIGRADLITPLLHYTELQKDVLDWTYEELGPKWKELAFMLGFCASEINDIVKENLGDDTTHSLVMLKKWKQRVDLTKDQLGRLCDALTDVGKKKLVRRLQHYRVVSGDKWHDIASFIGEDDWVKLAGVLGFSSEEIDTIKTDTSDDWKDQCCSMLEKWNHRQSMNEDQCIEKLCAALTDIGRKGLAVLLQQHSHDETQIKSNSKTRVSLNNGLRALAESIKPADWEKLALVLGFGKEDLFQIEEFYPHDFQSSYFDFESLEDEPVYCRCGPEPAYSTLLIWKHRQSVGGDKLLEKLGEVLNEIGKSHLATLLPLRPVLINDEVLMEMVRRLGPGWKELVTSLGISSKEVATMEGDQPSDQALCMLKEWNRLQGRNNDHYGKLCDVLANIGKVDLIGPLLHYTELHQEVLDWTSEEIGPEWKELALMLGFCASEINDIVKENLGDDTTHSLVMLKKWKQRVDLTKDQLGRMCDALTDVGKKKLVRRLQHYRVVSGDKWHDIASFIGEDDWVKLAGVLDFSLEEIDTIRADTPGDWKDQCCSMLDKWNHRQGTSEYQCIEKLCAALTDIGRKGLAVLLQQHNQDVGQTRERKRKTGVTLDKGLKYIAPCIERSDWGKLAIFLGFSKEDIRLIKELHRHEWQYLHHRRPWLCRSQYKHRAGLLESRRSQFRDSCCSMLLIWKHRQAVCEEEILDKLCDAISSIGRKDLARQLRRRYGRSESPRVKGSDGAALQPESAMPSDVEMLPTGHIKDGEVEESEGTAGDDTVNSAEEVSESVKISPESNSKQPPSRLQMILDEYHSQTRDFSDEERLDTCFRLPYIAIGHFNESGGSLSLDNYGVHLTIPPGAIPPGPPQEVYIYVDPSALLTDGDDPTKIALSRRVKCGPTGLKFAESVVLSFPHQADVTSMDPKGFSARMCQDDDSPKTWKEFDENLVVVTKDRVILFVNHFTWYALEFLMKLMSLGSSSKRLLVAAYGDNFVRNGRTYQFRVWVLNDDEAIKKNVEADEKLNRLDGFRNLLFRWGGGGVYVKLSQFPDGCQVPEGEEQIIDETKISNHPSNSVTFTLRQLSKLPGDDLYCSVETYQKRADGDSRKQSKSCLSICAAIKTDNCAEMDARDRGVAVGNAALIQSTSSIGAESNGTTISLQDEIKNGFSKRRREGNGHCGDPKKSFDLYREVQQQLKGQNGSGDSCRIFVTLHSDQVLCIQKPGILREITLTECNKIVQEITRQHVAPNHGVTELQVSKKEEIMSDKKGIKDATLRLFSKELGAEWEALATFLGFSSPDIYQFKNDNPHDTSNQIFQMLVGWRDERYPEALVNTLKTNIVAIYGEDIEIGLDDSSLQEVSFALGPEWEALATSLGFSETDILEIKDGQDQILKVLLGWRNKQLSPEAQLEWLCCELKKIDRENLADKLRDFTTDESIKKTGLPVKRRQPNVNDAVPVGILTSGRRL